MTEKKLRVFISYAHENEPFVQAVHDLAVWLTGEQIEVITDHLFENRAPKEGWIAWMLHEIEKADVVLIVCSPKYKERFEKRITAGPGAGVLFEGAIITQDLYDEYLQNEKYFPILPDGGNVDHIPQVLKTFYNGDKFPSGNEKILRLIRNDPVTFQPPPASTPPKQPGLLSGPEDNRLEPTEGEVLGRDEKINEVLDALRKSSAAHVSGGPGAGKTEVCKAALKKLLAQEPQSPVFWVTLPDKAESATLFYYVGEAIGRPDIVSMEQLLRLIPPGLYYLDNLEGVANEPEGEQSLSQLSNVPGVRLFASSRINLDPILGHPIIIDILPQDAAVALFQRAWNGDPKLEKISDELREFILKDLGAHALTIALIARLGYIHTPAKLIAKWKKEGPAMARAGHGVDKASSLTRSLNLTRAELAKSEGCLQLWLLAAIFSETLDEDTADDILEMGKLNDTALENLCRHHILILRGGFYRVFPPLARYALEEAKAKRGSFIWKKAQKALYGYFLELALPASKIADSDEKLKALGELLRHFTAVHKFMLIEADYKQRDIDKLLQLYNSLFYIFQFRPSLSKEIAIKIMPAFNNHPSIIRLIGKLERMLENHDIGRKHMEMAMEAYKGMQSLPAIAATMLELGDMENYLWNLKPARENLEKAKSLLREDTINFADRLRSLGELDIKCGEYDSARENLDEAAAVYVNIKSGYGSGFVLYSVGNLEFKLGNYEEARKAFKDALDIGEHIKDDRIIGNALMALGKLELQLGAFREARINLDRAMPLCKSESSDIGLGICYQILGELETKVGNYEPAQENLKTAYELYDKKKFDYGRASSCRSHGDLYLAMKDHRRALESYGQAEPVFSKIPDPIELAYTLAGAMRCHHYLGQEKEKTDVAHRAIAAAKTYNAQPTLDFVKKGLEEVGLSALM